MKTPAFRGLLAALAVVLAHLAPAGVAAAATYVLNVPQRVSPLLPLARVKVTLAGAGAAPSVTLNGTTLTVGGVSVVANPSIPGTPTDVVIAQVAGADLVLDINLDSLVQVSPLKPCILSPGFTAGSVPYTITLGGAAVSTGHRITAYTSLSENISDDGCLTRKRRVAGVVPTWSGTQPPGGSELPRAPIDTILVVDESGSMFSPASGFTPPSKWDETEQAVTEFVSVLGLESSVPDRLALIFYDDTVRKITSKASGACGGLCWFSKPEFGEVAGEIAKAIYPHGGMTTVGGGLDAALTDAVANLQNDTMIVLMSDGMQNTSPCIVPDPATVLTIAPSGPCPGVTPGTTIVSKKIPVLGITIGLPPASSGALDLQLITNQTAFSDSNWSFATQLAADSYGNALIQLLKGNTLQLAAQAVTAVPAGQPAGAPLAALLDGTIRRVVVLLGWTPVQATSFALRLQGKPPGGEWVDLGQPDIGLSARAAVVGRHPHLIATAFDLPADKTGEWAFRAVRRSENAGEVRYHLRVHAVEKSLDFSLRVAPGRHATGQPLAFEAELSLDGAPMTGIGKDLQVAAEGPMGAIGTLLHDTPDPGARDGGASEPAANPHEKKMSNLLADPSFVAKIGSQPTGGSLTLTELGGGRYRVQLGNTQLPGGYKFKFALNTPGPAGRLRRVEELTTQVEALPDPAATAIAVSAIAGGFAVTITPRDRFGNYIGPGFNHRVSVTLPGGQGTVSPVQDPATSGAYVVQLTDFPPGDPVVSVVVNETKVKQAPLSKLPLPPCPPGGGGCGCSRQGAGGTCLPMAGLVVVGLLKRRRRR